MNQWKWVIWLALAGLLSACASRSLSEPAPVNSDTAEAGSSLRGEVIYLDRRALSERAELVLALTRVDQPGPLIATQTRALDGEQIPIPFKLALPDDVDRDQGLELRAALLEPDGTVRMGSTAEFTPGESSDLGTLRLGFLSDEDFEVLFRCGDARVRFLSLGDRGVLAVDGDQYILDSRVSASGSRFARDGVELWVHQGEARLTLNGEDYPDCARVVSSSLGEG